MCQYFHLYIFSLLVTCTLVTCVPTIDISTNGSCEEMGAVAEQAVYEVMMLGRDAFPRTEDDVVKYCEQGEVALKRFGEYKKCLKGFPRQVFVVIRGNVKSVVKELCGSQDKRKGESTLLKPSSYNKNTCIYCNVFHCVICYFLFTHRITFPCQVFG